MLAKFLIFILWTNEAVSVWYDKLDRSDVDIKWDKQDMTVIAPSPQKLIELAEMEVRISAMLRKYSQNLMQKIGLISNYLKDLEDSTRGSEYTKNPISAYRMIRRYAKLLRNLHGQLSKDTFSDAFKKMLNGESEIEALSKWPADLDLNYSMNSILRLYQVYDFNVNEFADGNIIGVMTPNKMDSVHCKEIGLFAVEIKYYSAGVLWLETALERTSQNTTDYEKVKESLEYAKGAHDLAWSSKMEGDYSFFKNKLNGTEHRSTLRRLASKTGTDNQENSTRMIVPFWDLCTGQNRQTEAEKSDLFCRYETKSNPAWRINPLKIEELSSDPPLIQIYDILGPQTIRDINEEGRHSMRRGHVSDYSVDGATSISSLRTAMESWLSRGSNVSLRIRRTAELITGLNILCPTCAEDVALAYYAFGGHYVPHLDAFHKVNLAKHQDWGNRIATLVYYLEDIEVGGFTAFPKIGVAVKPIKGSAIFWYSLLRNGDFDYKSVHGACPVLLGHKSIATIFIRANSQMFNRPCELDSYYGDD